MTPLLRELGDGSLNDIGKVWREKADGSLVEVAKVWREEADGSLTLVYQAQSTISNLQATDDSSNCTSEFPVNQVEVTWDLDGDGDDVDHIVLRRTEPTGFDDGDEELSWGTTSYTDNDLGSGITACYEAWLEYTDGSSSERTDEACATTC